MLAGGADHEQAQARPGDLGVDLLDDIERLADVGAAPAGARLGDLEVAAGRGAAPTHPTAARPHVEEFPRLVLGQHAGDVIVHHDHLLCVADPLPGENADGSRPEADAPALPGTAVDDRRPAGRTLEPRDSVDGELPRL